MLDAVINERGICMSTQGILNQIINFLLPVVGIALVIFCVVQAFKLFSGSASGSVKKLITGVVLLLAIAGIMVFAGTITEIRDSLSGLVSGGVNNLTEDVGTIIGAD